MTVRPGFTLIELMIVVAIIAIVAAIAIPNLLRSRMAANETAAIAACKTFADAEEVYHRSDYNRDGVLEYAQHLGGTNSLLESVSGSNDLGLIDKNFAAAEGTGIGKQGYNFQIITSQGSFALGGRHSYLPDGTHMTVGYGLSALPVSYDGSGRDTFVINNNGIIMLTDQGSANNTHITVFNPVTGSWAVSE